MVPGKEREYEEGLEIAARPATTGVGTGSTPRAQAPGPCCLTVVQFLRTTGYEALHMIRKGRARWVNYGDVRRQNQFIDQLFEPAG